MDEHLVDMWNRDVKPDDVVYFLGDFSLKFTMVEKYLPRLQGNIFWVPGNHDAIHPMHKGSSMTIKKLPGINPKVLVVRCQETLKVGNKLFLLCHFPWAGEVDPHSDEHNKYEDRYKEWRPQRKYYPKHFLLRGHTHSEPEKRLGENFLDVGFDAWGRMVNLEEIINR